MLKNWRFLPVAVVIAVVAALPIWAEGEGAGDPLFELELVGTFPFAGGETLCSFAVSPNGNIAYHTQQGPQKRIYFRDGADIASSMQLVWEETGSGGTGVALNCDAMDIGVNDDGLIAVKGAALPPLHESGVNAVLHFRPGVGLVGYKSPPPYPTCGYGLDTRANLSPWGSVAFNAYSGNVCIGSMPPPGSSSPIKYSDAPGVTPYPWIGGGAVINANNEVAQVGILNQPIFGDFLGILDWSPFICLPEYPPEHPCWSGGALHQTLIGPWDDWATVTDSPGLNGKGYATIATGRAASADHHGVFPASPFRVILLPPDRETQPPDDKKLVVLVADSTVVGSTKYTWINGVHAWPGSDPPSFNPVPVGPTWLSEDNVVLFGVTEPPPQEPPVSPTDSLWVMFGGMCRQDDRCEESRDSCCPSYPHPGVVPLEVWKEGTTSLVPGGSPGKDSLDLPDYAMDGHGHVVFAVRNDNIRGLFRATPRPGLLPSKPVVPKLGNYPVGDYLEYGWRLVSCHCAGSPFAQPTAVAVPCGHDQEYFPPGSTLPVEPTCWVDPLVAEGYTFTADPASRPFESVTAPPRLPGGDEAFTVEVGNASAPLAASATFDFTANGFPDGVTTFRITGIDPGENLSPDDATAFVVGLTWLGRHGDPTSFTMVPIVLDTDDDDEDGVINATDNCATTSNPDQSDADANGLGDACDTSATPGEATDLRVTSYDRITENLNLAYTPACESSSHDIYYGPLSQVGTYAWSGSTCDIGHTGKHAGFNPGPGSYFFVVVGNAGGVEGSYGADSLGAQRPAAGASYCDRAQELATACP